jgi:hypothetical protein
VAGGLEDGGEDTAAHEMISGYKMPEYSCQALNTIKNGFRPAFQLDKTQLGAAIIAFSLLTIASPFALAKAVTSPAQFIGAITAVDLFYGIVFLVMGIAVFFVKEEREASSA